MNFRDDILSKPSLVAYWRLGQQDVWKRGGVVDAVAVAPRTNLVLNPRAEVDLTNLIIVGGTSIVRDTTRTLDGSASILLTKGASFGYAEQQALMGRGATPVRFSAMVYYPTGGLLDIVARPTGSIGFLFNQVTVPAATWTRVSAVFTPAADCTAINLDIGWEQNDALAGAQVWICREMASFGNDDPFGFDGYGNSELRWTGTPHASTSQDMRRRLFARANGNLTVGSGVAQVPADPLAKSTVYANSSADYLSLPHDSAISAALLGDFTFLAVVNVSSIAANRGVFSKMGNSAAAPFDVRVNSGAGQMIYTFGDGTTGSGFNDGSAMPTGTAVLVGCTVSGTSIKMYRNGVQAGGTGSMVGISRGDVGNALLIGVKGNFTDAFFGGLQDVALFNAALSASEMLALAQESGFA